MNALLSYLHPLSVSVLNIPSMTAAQNCPMVMNTEFRVTSLPRYCVGETSAMYRGTVIDDRP